MSRSLGNIIADSLELGLGYAERLLDGVTDDSFARMGHTGRTAIVSNHPAFVFGHLSLYAPQVLTHLESDSEAKVPSHFEQIFSKDATCQDDPDRTIYPPQAEVTSVFFESYRAAAAALREADDRQFDPVNPVGGRFAERFPTVGSMLSFYCGGHLMLHLGQVSAWRRMRGLGPA